MFQQHKTQFIFLSALACFCFALYSYFPFVTGTLFNSPDENANYIFSKTFAERSELKLHEPLNMIAGNVVTPRSMRAAGDVILPGSFLGMPLFYGAVAKVLGIAILLFLTPFFAALGILFFYGLLTRVFSRRVALIASVLLVFHPAYWYYASRSMMHNSLFLTLFIAGLFFFTFPKEQTRRLWYFLGGMCLLGSLAIRTSEAVWVVLVGAFLVYAYAREVSWKFAPWALFGAASVFLPILFWNAATFGSPLSFGYVGGGGVGTDGGVAVSTLQSIAQSIFPFGFHPRLMLHIVGEYLVTFFWWYSAGIALGLLYFFIRLFHWKKKHFVYAIAFLIGTAWLVTLYGSWDFRDNPTPGLVTIGTSYVRYFLPIYAFSLPLIALVITKIISLFSSRIVKTMSVVGLCFIFLFFSARVVLWETDESLLSVARTLGEYGQRKTAILEATETDAVIIAANLDKVLFPDRRVMTNIKDVNVIASLPVLLDRVPVYAYSRFTPEEVEELNTSTLASVGVQLIPFRILSAHEDLLKIVRVEPLP